MERGRKERGRGGVGREGEEIGEEKEVMET